MDVLGFTVWKSTTFHNSKLVIYSVIKLKRSLCVVENKKLEETLKIYKNTRTS